MKKFVLLILLFIICLLQSCQSEYSERMIIALELKQRYIDLNEDCKDVLHPYQKQKCDELKEQILFQAKVSGNEKLFLDQIDLDID